MSYVKTNWVDEGAPPINATNLNKIEDGISNNDQRIEALEQGASGGGLTDGIKQALLQIAQKVAYIDEHGQDYYDDLYDALYAVTAVNVSPTTLSFSTLGETQQLTATTTPSGASVTWASSNTSIATVSASGLVTSVAYGTATITATAGQLSATCAVVVAQATLTSITAAYTQSGTVYDTDSLDSLKSDLVVTAYYDNSTSAVVPSADYTLSGTLTEGTSTITVTYGNYSDTFTVTVTHNVLPLLSWDFTQSLVDSIQGETATLSGCTQDANGVTFPSGDGALKLGNSKISIADKTFIINFAATPTTGTNPVRLFMIDSSDMNTASGAAGFIYRLNANSYNVYTGSAWGATGLPSTYGMTFFTGKRMKIYVDSDLYLTISYADIGSESFTTIQKMDTAFTSTYAEGYFVIGSTSYANMTGTIVSAVKVYSGEV